MLFDMSVLFVCSSTISTSDHSIGGPFSLLSELFSGRFDAGMRISGANEAGAFVVVISGLTDGATSGTLVVDVTIGWFTLVLLSGAMFSLIVDSVETERLKGKYRAWDEIVISVSLKWATIETSQMVKLVE